MRLDWTCRRVDAVTLVALRLENDAGEPRRVRVENRLDGPVRPPRRGGRPAAGWTAAGYEGVLDPGETRALGYACPAPPVDPPAAVEASPAPSDANGSESESDGQSAGGVVAALGDPRPPRDAVPTPGDGAESGAAADAASSSSSSSNPDSGPDSNQDPGLGPERAGTSAGPEARTASDGGSDVSGFDSRGAGAEPPVPVTDWLDDVAGRIESDALAPGEERALAVVGQRIAAIQVALAERRHR